MIAALRALSRPRPADSTPAEDHTPSPTDSAPTEPATPAPVEPTPPPAPEPPPVSPEDDIPEDDDPDLDESALSGHELIVRELGATVVEEIVNERVFENPEEFRPDRPGLKNHLAFGHGIHFCLGAALARLEAVTALQTLASAIESFRVVDRDSLRYGGSFILRGLERLELDVTYA